MQYRISQWKARETVPLGAWSRLEFGSGILLQAMMARSKPDGKNRPLQARCVVLVLLLALDVFCIPGCRAFRGDTTNKPLVTARQLSLRGAEAMQRSRYQDAELLFSQALAISPLDERAHWGYATTLWNRGERQKATQHMGEALRLSGRNPDYAIQLGEMNLELGEYGTAKKIALDVLSDNRNHARAWALLGDTHRAENEWVEARECYHRALLVRSDYPRVQLSIAEIYRKQGRPERALSTLDRMIDLHSAVREDPEQMLLRGLAFADLNRPTEAASLLAKAAEQLPTEQLDRHLEVLDAQQRMGELVQARITLGRLMTEHAGNPRVQGAKSALDASFVNMAQSASPKTPTATKPPYANEVSNPTGEDDDQGGKRISTVPLSDRPGEPLRR
jgi:tetratricopeptide (TPR) repeat protein